MSVANYRWRSLRAFLALGALLSVTALAVACGGGGEKATPTTAPAAPTTAPAAPVATAAPAVPTTAPAPPAAAERPTITMAAGLVGQIVGDPSTAPYAKGVGPGNLGIRDYMFQHDGETGMGAMLAKSWEMTPDLKKFRFKLEEGVPWINPNLPETKGMDFGEFTAEDVAWFINRHNPNVNADTTAGDGGQLASYFGECRAAEKYVAECDAVNPAYFGLPLSMMIILDAGPAVESKKAAELLGDKLPDIAIGTGPFTLGEWKANEKGTIHATEKNWFHTAKIGTFKMIQVPEVASRIAMLETGQADVMEMDFSIVPQLRSKGLDFMPTMTLGDTENASVIWPGNLWEEVHARTGEPLNPWDSPVYEKDYPWIGNPWGDKVPYTDTDNPPGMSDMEQARLVRWALSYAIDRDGIVEQLQSGIGTPIYLEYMGPEYPGWDPNRTVTKAKVDGIIEKYGCSVEVHPLAVEDCPSYNVPSPIPDQVWPWKIPWDPDFSEKLLDMAGYPKKNGVRFEIQLNKYRCETGDVCLEQADAVGASWDAIGVKTTLATEDYGAVVSQGMRARIRFYPVVKNCSVESANEPLDWPMPPADSSLTRPGWGCGFEAPFSASMQVGITNEPDKATREQMHLDIVDWMYYWELYNGVAQQPRGVGYNPKTVKSWGAPSSQGPNWYRPEYITPA